MSRDGKGNGNTGVNRLLEIRRGDYERDCKAFLDWLLPQMVWDMAPQAFLMDAYRAWCEREGRRPLSKTRFYGACEWAAWNGMLGAWGPCKRKGGDGMRVRFVVDQPVAEKLGLDQWQPSKGFRPRSMYVGLGR